MKKVLVLAAHPDDEILGCGGTIAKHIRCGDEVNVVIVTEGVTARDPNRNYEKRKDELEQLAHMAHQAHKILKPTSFTMLNSYPDNRMDSVNRLDVIKLIESLLIKYKPEVVYTHHVGDVNIDHRRIHEAVVTACRAQPNFFVKQLLFFEVPSSTEWQPPQSAQYFMPNWFVDITSELELKMKALAAYEGELRDYPHPRSLKGVEYLARWRGVCVGVDAAEAFMVGRTIC